MARRNFRLFGSGIIIEIAFASNSSLKSKYFLANEALRRLIIFSGIKAAFETNSSFPYPDSAICLIISVETPFPIPSVKTLHKFVFYSINYIISEEFYT